MTARAFETGSAWEMRDERQSLTARERQILVDLARGPMPYNQGRSMGNEYRVLLGQGLIFHALDFITITDKGRAVVERVS